MLIVVWEEIPESCTIYKFDAPTPEQLQLAKACHGLYINSSELTPVQETDMDMMNEWIEKSVANKVEGPLELKDREITIVVCGFIL